RTVEHAAIDHRGEWRRRRVRNLDPRRRHEARRRQLIESRLGREAERVEALGSENPRAVHRIADERVFFTEQRRDAATSQTFRSVQPRRAAANDEHVVICHERRHYKDLTYGRTVSDFASTDFPRATSCNPERERDQTHVEPEARASEIESIETELARAR